MRIWSTRTRIKVFSLSLLLIFLSSVFGFLLIKYYIEDQTVTFVESIYWTVITLATLGYYPPGLGLESHIGMAFTIIVVLSGLVTIFLGVPSIVAPWLEERLNRIKDSERIPIPTAGHVVVVGYGAIGRSTVAELTENGLPCVVIGSDREVAEELESSGIPFVHGNGSDEGTLRASFIEKAVGLALVGRDEENIFACLTARKLRSDIPITALARGRETEKLLYKIGANRVVTPKNAVGSMLAKRAVGVYGDLVEGKGLLGDLDIRQYTLAKDNHLVGRTLGDSALGRLAGVVVLGVWRDGVLDASPPPEREFHEGDIMVALGMDSQFNALENLFVGVGGEQG